MSNAAGGAMSGAISATMSGMPSATTPVAHLVREHLAARRSFRPVGSGTWLHGGGPFADAEPIAVRSYNAGVVEYEPGDLVITVGAGMTWRELAQITAAHGQMFALAPYGSDDSTLGAMVSTAAAAPLALGDLLMRDLVLGLEVVDGTGEVLRAGGRVVKNVAGFDLVRLFTGAHGTLGIITQLSLRLHARPPLDRLMRVTMSRPVADALAGSLPALIAQRAPLPLLLSHTPGQPLTLWARVSGNAARVAALRAQLAALAGTGAHEVDDLGDIDTPFESPVESSGESSTHAGSAAAVLSPLDALRHTPANAAVMRLRTPRSDALPFVQAVHRTFPDASWQYHVERGSLRLVVPNHLPHDVLHHAPSHDAMHESLDTQLDLLYHHAAAQGALHRIAVAWDQGRAVPAPRSALDQQVKARFDPAGLCSPWRVAPELLHDAVVHTP